MKKRIGLILICFLLVGGCGCRGEEVALTKTSVILDWTPNTNHSGLYVAQEKGYYREVGLDLEILEASELGADQLVGVGQVDFGVSYQENVTNARSVEIPLVSLAAVIQHNTSGFVSLKEENLVRPRDLEGKRYGGWGSPAEKAVLEAVVRKDGGDPDTIELVDIGATDFLAVLGRQIDFYWLFQGWDGLRAEQEEVELNIIKLRDFEPILDYYTPVIITNEKVLAEKADLVAKFMEATCRGYQFCITEPDQAAEILLRAVPELDQALVRASQQWLSKEYQAMAPYWGWQEEEVWARYATWLYEQGLLSKEIEVEKAFTNDFLVK